MTQVNLKGNPIKLIGNFLKAGDQAPDFQLVDDSLKDIRLSQISGVKLLSIVPSLDTEVCLISTKKFNEEAKKRPDLNLLIISGDLPFAQKRVCGVEKLDNIKTLSMMRDKSFAQDYGVLIEEGPLAGLCSRAVLVLDASNKVIYSELVSEITNEPNYEEAIKALT